LARAVAILGAGAELGLAAALAGLDRSAAATAAGALVRADLLQAGPMLQFSHPVVRAAVYEAIDAAERVEAHRRAARLLDDRGADPEQVAAHLLLVAPAADPLVTSTLFEAARRALARGAAETAVTYLRRALAEPPEGSERSRLLWELGLAESRIDVPAAAEHLLEALKREQDPDSYGQIALRCGRVLFYAGRNREAIDMLREATNRVDARSPGVREQLQAELISSIRMEPTLYPEARQLIDGIAQTGVDSVKTDVLLAVLAYDELLRGVDRQRATTLAERALRIGSLKDAGSVTLHYALGVLPHAGRPNALANFDDVIAASRRRGALLDLAILLGTRGWFIKEEGDLLAAEADGREALSLAEQLGAPLIVMFAAACFASVLLERGNAEEASRALAQANVGERVPESTQLIGAWFLNARGKLRLEQRNPEAALRSLSAPAAGAPPARSPHRCACLACSKEEKQASCSCGRPSIS
jgi:tetratricopeptide (TPR) repeat protein